MEIITEMRGGCAGRAGLCPAFLDKLYLITLRRVDKSDAPAGAGRVRPIGERIPLCRGVTRKRVHILHFKCQMSQVRPHDHRAAGVVFADLDQLLAAGRLEKNQLRAAPGGKAPDLLQAEDIPVKCHRLLEVRDAVAGVKKFFDHKKLAGGGPLRP